VVAIHWLTYKTNHFEKFFPASVKLDPTSEKSNFDEGDFPPGILI